VARRRSSTATPAARDENAIFGLENGWTWPPAAAAFLGGFVDADRDIRRHRAVA
jgi:hypothetical protein